MADRPRLRVPAGACDCHMHFYGPEQRYPLASSAPFPPPTALVADYRRVQKKLGLERVVVVQPTAYGKDNACTLDAVAEIGLERARAIVVVDQDASDAELQRLTAGGARGIRFHMLAGGILPWDAMAAMAARVEAFGWHVQLQCNGHELVAREALLKDLPGQLVIDHVGRFEDPVPPEHPAFQALLRLLANGRVWVKLSSPYGSSKSGPPAYADVGVLARALVAAAPERMLWASNWPHPGQPQILGGEAGLLDLLLDWAPDAATRQRILVDNPAALYGFSAASGAATAADRGQTPR